ncbi:MAG: AlpA family phage regulatory protein [Alphaproteobacteria bacterium]|nr:AlpA family phage regulatory protein [Alphaproteobacteria bacterium]
MNILRPKATAQKCGVTPITIRRWATEEKYRHMKFPKPLSLGENSVGYPESEVDEFLEARAAKRGAT